MASCDLPTPPRPTRAIRPAGSEHRWSIWSRMSPRLTKSGSREGIVAKGGGGVSGRSTNVSRVTSARAALSLPGTKCNSTLIGV